MTSIRGDDSNKAWAYGFADTLDRQFQFAFDHFVDFLLRMAVLVDRCAGAEFIVRKRHVRGMEIAAEPAGQALDDRQAGDIDQRHVYIFSRNRRIDTNVLCDLHASEFRSEGDIVKTVTQFGLLTIIAAILTFGCGPMRVGVGIGGLPLCPYGYYEMPPYACTPDGYYGPEWFNGGIFIGAGPWYHGPRRFYGHVDHDLDIRQGYRGPLPERRAPEPPRAAFRGQAMHDFHGREAPAGRR